VKKRAKDFPKSSTNSASKVYQQQQMLAIQLVACLTSSKVETRSSSEALLRKCVEVDTLSLKNIRKGIEKLLPAQQRTVSSVLENLSSPEAQTEKKTKCKSRTEIRDKSRGRKSAIKSRPSKIQGNDEFAIGKSVSEGLQQVPRIYKKQSNSEMKEPLKSANDFGEENPLQLKNSNYPSKDSRSSSSSRKRDNWPEHPEEPNRSEQLLSLKKVWPHLLQNPVIDLLIPSTGMRKQEDAIPGVAIIETAIDITFDENDDYVIVEQLDLIFKWLICALYSREHTAGLQALLNLLRKLFNFLIKRKYQLSDFEASLLLPYLLEKASIAKASILSLVTKVNFEFVQLRNTNYDSNFSKPFRDVSKTYSLRYW